MPLGSLIRRAVVFALLCLCGVHAMSPAQEPAKPMEPAKEAPVKEQTIYVPYTKLRAMFEKEGRGVFLPYDKFQELWKQAQAAAHRIEEFKPPVGAIITQIENQATTQKDVVSVTAKISIDLLTEGWHEVPLRLADSAIRSAKIGDEPARVIFAPEGYKLLYEKKGKEPSQIVLTLEYSKAFSKQPGTNTVTFDAPQAPINRWQITIPEPGVKVQVHPNLSATDAMPVKVEPKPEDKPEDAPKELPKETKVEALVGSAPQVQITWNPKAEGAAGQMALATAQVREEVLIEEGVMRTRLHVAYEISRADLKELSVQVPADQNVVYVLDPNVLKWEKKTEGPIQTITITLFQAVRGTQNVTLELEKFSDDKEMAKDMGRKEFTVPDVKVLNVARQQGVVVARLGGALRGEVAARNGLLQIDAADLPAPLAGQDWPFAYRYAAHPYSLTLSVEKVRPQIEVDELVEAYLEPQQITLDLLAIFSIEKAGVFQLELDVPEGFDVRQVQGRDAAGAAAVAVDSHHVDEVVVDPAKPEVKAKTRLVVNLSRKAIGKVALWVELQQRQERPELLTPTSKTTAIDIKIPRVAPAKVNRVTGRFILYAPESLRVTPTDAKGLRNTSAAEALQGVESTRGGRFPLTRELLAYAYTQEPVSLKLEAGRRDPFISAEQLVFVSVESGLVKYEVTISYNVQYSGVKTLRIDVPADLYEKKELLPPPGLIKKIEPQPKDVPAGYVALEVSSDGEFLGASEVKFTGERKLADLQVGKSVKFALPVLKPHGVDRHTGKIAAAKAETIDLGVDGKATGLRPIDPQRDLPAGKLSVPAAMAFEFVGDWALTLLATRYELEDVKRTSIDRAFVRMVMTRGKETSVQALYRIRSAKQRIAIKLPGAQDEITLDRQSLKVNNQPVSLETDKTQYFIPLIGHNAEEYLLVELRYSIKRTSTLELPEFPDDPAVQQVYLAAYMPEEQRLLGVQGEWTEEYEWLYNRRTAQRELVNSRDDNFLLNWVHEGTSGGRGADTFPADGTRYLYSSLRPAAGAAGGLTIVSTHRYVLWTLIVLVVAGVGLGLSTQPIGIRLWWLAALIVAVVLSALFAPTFAEAVLNPVFCWSLCLVLLVWLVQFLYWALPKAGTWYSAQTARAAAMASAMAAAAASPPVAAAAPAAPGGTPFATGPTEIRFGDVKTPPPPGSTGEGKEGGGSNV
ncbi:MAG: hypothetical protein IAF94_12890 [Pirellulaceae bacterium]|nr:hypothetical protein [Pirellulaceae bacterium]